MSDTVSKNGSLTWVKLTHGTDALVILGGMLIRSPPSMVFVPCSEAIAKKWLEAHQMP